MKETPSLHILLKNFSSYTSIKNATLSSHVNPPSASAFQSTLHLRKTDPASRNLILRDMHSTKNEIGEYWYRGGDSNPYGISPTAPLKQRVYQFHHLGKVIIFFLRTKPIKKTQKMSNLSKIYHSYCS